MFPHCFVVFCNHHVLFKDFWGWARTRSWYRSTAGQTADGLERPSQRPSGVGRVGATQKCSSKMSLTTCFQCFSWSQTLSIASSSKRQYNKNCPFLSKPFRDVTNKISLTTNLQHLLYTNFCFPSLFPHWILGTLRFPPSCAGHRLREPSAGRGARHLGVRAAPAGPGQSAGRSQGFVHRPGGGGGRLLVWVCWYFMVF